MTTELQRLKELENLVSDILSHFPERDLYLHVDGAVGTLDQFAEPKAPFTKSDFCRLLDFNNPRDLGLMLLYEMVNCRVPDLTAVRNSYDIL